jgi:hypothetical protein
MLFRSTRSFRLLVRIFFSNEQIATQGLLAFLCELFPQYLRLSTVYMYYKTMPSGMYGIGWIYNYKICEFSVVAMFFFSMGRLLLIPSKRSELKTEMEELRVTRKEAMTKDWASWKMQNQDKLQRGKHSA